MGERYHESRELTMTELGLSLEELLYMVRPNETS